MPEFINTDLVLASDTELGGLEEEMRGDVGVHYCGAATSGYLLSVAPPVCSTDCSPEGTVGFLCGLAEKLSPKAKRAWDACQTRIFDLGFEGSVGNRTLEVELSPSTILRVAQLKAGVRITIYPEFRGGVTREGDA